MYLLIFIFFLLVLDLCIHYQLYNQISTKCVMGLVEETVYKKQKKKNKTKREYLEYLLSFLFAFVLSGIFFKDFTMGVMFGIGALFFPRLHRKRVKKKEIDVFLEQFKESLRLVKNTLKVGKSLQSAIIHTEMELAKIYASEKAPIRVAYKSMSDALQMGVQLNDVLMTFKSIYPCEEAENFVDIAIITHKKGGNLVEVIGSIETFISTTIHVKQEVKILTASKIMESKMLTLMPFFLVTVISVLSPEYMAPLYETAFGKLLMAIGVVLIVMNYIIGTKIVRIDV